MVETPDLTLLRQQNAELLRQLETSTARLAKVEGEFGVLKHSQSMTLCGLWIVAALLIVVIAPGLVSTNYGGLIKLEIASARLMTR